VYCGHVQVFAKKILSSPSADMIKSTISPTLVNLNVFCDATIDNDNYGIWFDFPRLPSLLEYRELKTKYAWYV